MTNDVEETKPNNPDCFGGCPICGTNNGYLNVGREHWFVCDTHRIRWRWGINLMSTWRFENENDWKTNWEQIGDYEVREPWFPSAKE